ncbi:MAG: FecR family protein [Acidobacteriota bacterium]|nr:FecR family protein [Acidobacteriota bacterium]
MLPRLGHALALGTLVFALATGAVAQVDADVYSKARIVRLSFVQGDVRMDRPDSGGLDTAFLNMPIVEGSRVVTGDDGFAELEFESGGTVRLTPGSELRVRELGLRGEHQVSMLEVGDGTVYCNVKKDSDDDFRVVVNGQEVRVAKSARFRIRGGRGNAEIAVTKGEVELIGSAQAVRIKKDETLTLDPQDPGRYFLARNVTPFSYDTWDRERDEYRERYVATSSSYRGYSSGYSYGVSDLNYYGSYINAAGYGYVWRPYGYSASWDPFSDGAWVWYPGYGYTWVSGYAWGWMPYRYGRWVYIGGYGWVWQPGNSWRRWNRCTAVYNPPHNYHLIAPPTGGGGHRGGGAGGGGGRVVVVGQGPFTGHGPGFKNDGDGLRPGGKRRVVVVTDGSGSGTPAPAVLTPGLGTPGTQTPGTQTPGTESVVEALRRVHGQDLGLPGRMRRQPADTAEPSTTTVAPTVSTPSVTTTTGSTGAGGSATTGGGTSPAKPTQQVITPPRPVRGSRSEEGVIMSPAGNTATTMPTTTITMPARPAQSAPAGPSQSSPSRPSQSAPSQPPTSSYRGGSSGGGGSSRSSSSASPSSGSSGRSSSPSAAPARGSSSSHKDPK